MNFYDILLAKNLGGGGSTPFVDIEPLSVTENGVYEAPAGKAYDPVTVDVSGSGGSDYTLLYSGEVEASTTSTTATELTTITDISGLWDESSIIYVQIRDKAGKRGGYFFGGDAIIENSLPYWQSTQHESGSFTRYCYYLSTGSKPYMVSTSSSTTTGYGVYVSKIEDDGSIVISTRYDASRTKTIDGTFTVKVYKLKYPDNVSPFAH